jgi:hypothetical protein
MLRYGDMTPKTAGMELVASSYMLEHYMYIWAVLISCGVRRVIREKTRRLNRANDTT